MSNTLINLLVIVLVIGTIALAVFTYLTNKKRKAGSQLSDQTFRNCLQAQNFSPDHLAWFGGTGIAMKDGDARVAVHNKGKAQFYPLSNIATISTQQTTASPRPLGAAPGVVEIKTFQIFHLDLSFKNGGDPVKILLEDEARMQEWETRLKTAAGC